MERPRVSVKAASHAPSVDTPGSPADERTRLATSYFAAFPTTPAADRATPDRWGFGSPTPTADDPPGTRSTASEDSPTSLGGSGRFISNRLFEPDEPGPKAERRRRSSFLPGRASGAGGQAKPRRSHLFAATAHRPLPAQPQPQPRSQPSKLSKVSDFWGRRTTAAPRHPALGRAYRRASRVHEGLCVTALVVACTLLSLCLDDLRVLFASPPQDAGFSGVAFIVLVVFALDTLVSSLLRPGYLLSFFWVCDTLATLGMLPQVPWLLGHALSQTGSAGDSVYERGLYSPQQLYLRRLVQILQVVSLVRLIRFLRLYQQYEAACQQRRLQKDLRYAVPPLKDPYWWQAPTQDRVGRRFINLNTTAILLTVFAFAVAIPAFSPRSPYYAWSATPFGLGLALLHRVFLDAGADSAAFRDAVGTYTAADPQVLLGRSTQVLLQLTVCNRTLFQAYPFAGDELRTEELSLLYQQTPACGTPDSLDCLQSVAVLSVQWLNRATAILSLCRTAFVLLMLSSNFFGFAFTANRMILAPIDRLLKKVRDVADNPLVSHRASRQAGAGGPGVGQGARPGARAGAGVGAKPPPDRKWMEARLLERMLAKICSLLVIGFGEAGAQVITRNLKDGGELDPMVPGQQATAVFGFCDIRNFTDATEVLQTDIMEYVNSVAGIVHRETILHGGAPNKNIGDAFLLVWKFSKGFRREAVAGHAKSRSSFQPQRDLVADPVARPPGDPASKSSLSIFVPGSPKGSLGTPLKLSAEGLPSKLSAEATPKASANLGSESPPANPAGERRRRALDALFPEARHEPDRLPAIAASRPTFIPVGASVQEAQGVADRALAAALVVLAMLKRSPRLQQFCRRADIQRRMPGFQVKMGFGLHAGWAIEGAIGSEFKIDVSYLSPHVNLASRLEAATKQYGVAVLMSGDFAGLLSPEVRERTRQIDCVMVKGSDEPMAIHTYDVSLEAIPAPDPAALDSVLAEDATPTFSGRPYAWEFGEHPDLAPTWGADAPFLARFQEGFAAYQAGQWGGARAILEETLTWRRYADGAPLRDGPSGVLLDFMRSPHGFVAPPDWTGCRQLTEK